MIEFRRLVTGIKDSRCVAHCLFSSVAGYLTEIGVYVFDDALGISDQYRHRTLLHCLGKFL